MKNFDFVLRRMQSQHLVDNSFTKPEDVVRHFGAVQSQDYVPAKWGLRLRMKKGTDASIEKSFDEGKILRTHVMRPTWHFVLPEDIRWMLELTAPRLKKLYGNYDRKLDLNEKVLSRCADIVVKALKGGRHLTRAELADRIEADGIKARGQKLGHIVGNLEIDGLICSGAKRDKQFTYALLEERAPKVKRISREDALAKLALRYFAGHGPAQLKDFSWWSGLTMKDAVKGIEAVRSELEETIVEGMTYWHLAKARFTSKQPPKALLLSLFDEYVIAYKDRSALGGGRHAERFLSMGNALTSVLVIDGKLVGTWKKLQKKGAMDISVQPFESLKNAEKDAVHEQAERFGEFLGMPIRFSIK